MKTQGNIVRIVQPFYLSSIQTQTLEELYIFPQKKHLFRRIRLFVDYRHDYQHGGRNESIKA